MKKIIYFLAALMALSVTSCKEDDINFTNVDDLDRLPMPMFRRQDNTNIAESNDQYASKVISGIPNAIQLHWYGVEGASGYEIRYSQSRLISSDEAAWNDPAKKITHVILPADQLHYELYNLEYQNDYSFCIRALHPTDPSKNSKWYGMGTSAENSEYMFIPTGERYFTPFVVDTRDKDYDGFTVLLNLKYNRSDYDSQDADTIEKHFRIENGRFMATHLVVKASPINPLAQENPTFLNYELDPATDLVEQEDGFAHIRVTGLDPSALYFVALRDDKNPFAPYDVDRFYNYSSIRTKGDPGKDIIIEHKVANSIWIDPNAEKVDMDVEQKWFEGEQKYQACRIDTIFSQFASDITLAEGQTFLLKGGEAYYLRSHTNVCKGFTLKTDPADILAGKGRAKVYLGGLYKDPAGNNGYNWSLGKNKEEGEFNAPIKMENIIFQDIDFDCPESNNHGETVAGSVNSTTGNYFINMFSGGLSVEFESIQIRNCTFQGLRRGFFRIQGGSNRIINKLVIDNCVFFNDGYRSQKGNDYDFIHGEQETNTENMCKDLSVTNNTFFNCAYQHIINPTKNGFHKNLQIKDFAADVSWNIKVENNTFINSTTMNKSNRFFNVKYVPQGSTITFKRNLICLAIDESDQREMHCCGMTMEKVYGSGELHLDFKDNYSTGYKADNLVDDGIFSDKSTAFSFNKKSAGYFTDAFVGDMTADDLKVKVGENPLYSTELFTDPNPAYHATSKTDYHPELFYTDPATIWSRLQYKSDLKVQTHEIVTKMIGDQRWNGVAEPKFFYPAGAPQPEIGPLHPNYQGAE